LFFLRVVITVSVANSLSSLKPAIPLFTLPFNLVALFALVVLRVHHQVQQPARIPPPDFDWMHVSSSLSPLLVLLLLFYS